MAYSNLKCSLNLVPTEIRLNFIKVFRLEQNDIQKFCHKVFKIDIFNNKIYFNYELIFFLYSAKFFTCLNLHIKLIIDKYVCGIVC